jgi:hypothetical protein
VAREPNSTRKRKREADLSLSGRLLPTSFTYHDSKHDPSAYSSVILMAAQGITSVIRKLRPFIAHNVHSRLNLLDTDLRNQTEFVKLLEPKASLWSPHASSFIRRFGGSPGSIPRAVVGWKTETARDGRLLFVSWAETHKLSTTRSTTWATAPNG